MCEAPLTIPRKSVCRPSAEGMCGSNSLVLPGATPSLTSSRLSPHGTPSTACHTIAASLTLVFFFFFQNNGQVVGTGVSLTFMQQHLHSTTKYAAVNTNISELQKSSSLMFPCQSTINDDDVVMFEKDGWTGSVEASNTCSTEGRPRAEGVKIGGKSCVQKWKRQREKQTCSTM